MGTTAIILSGGGPGPEPATLPIADFVVAADSGVHLAERLGLTVDLIVGDLDSADPTTVETEIAAGARLDRHPVDKDATDLELALEAVRAHGADRVVVVGGGAGRLDHLLGVALLLAAPRWAEMEVEWRTESATGQVIDDSASIATHPGDLISVLPITPTATVSVSGTRWELDATVLEFGSTRGISNLATGDTVKIEVTAGSVFVIRPEQR